MVLLPFTNIIVDQFSQCKKSRTKYVHFLTHMHSDHFIGMCEGWNYGRIYCTKISANLLRRKFPSVKEVITLELNIRYTIEIADKININVTLLDANHCPGAVMFLFEGYMGTYLYTGDIRYDKAVFEQYEDLYPSHLANTAFERCSKKIDVLFLDNTFCDRVFSFPPRETVLKQIESLVQKCKDNGNRVLIALDNLGKEQILVSLAYKFLSLIVVSYEKYLSIMDCEIDKSIFTTTTEEGWIENIPKREMKARLMADPNAVGIVPTGWCNDHYVTFNGRLHMFPYSLHSNFTQLEDFVKSIQPVKIEAIVRNFQTKTKIKEDYGDIVKQSSIFKLSSLKQTGLAEITNLYTTSEHSHSHQQMFDNPELQKELSKIFRGNQKEEDSFNSQQFKKCQDMEKIIKQNLKRKPQPVKMVQRDDSEQISEIRNRLNHYKKIHMQQLEQAGVLEISQLSFMNKPMRQIMAEGCKSNPTQRSTKHSFGQRKTTKITKQNLLKNPESSISEVSESQSCNRETNKNLKRQTDSSLPARSKKKKITQPSINDSSKIIHTKTLQSYFKKVVKKSQTENSADIVFLD